MKESTATGPQQQQLDLDLDLDRGEHRHALPAFCCWNGLAVLRAEPFYRGLRFRSSRPGTGVQSECTHLCIDLWANGYSRVVVDPQVRGTVCVCVSSWRGKEGKDRMIGRT